VRRAGSAEVFGVEIGEVLERCLWDYMVLLRQSSDACPDLCGFMPVSGVIDLKVRGCRDDLACRADQEVEFSCLARLVEARHMDCVGAVFQGKGLGVGEDGFGSFVGGGDVVIDVVNGFRRDQRSSSSGTSATLLPPSVLPTRVRGMSEGVAFWAATSYTTFFGNCPGAR
jgi:hypothetical protein